MKRVAIGEGRYVPADPNGEPSLCRCKPWHQCLVCGLVEHAGGFCSYCGSRTTLERLVKRPSFNVKAWRAARVAS